MENRDLRFLLIGKNGHGKSATGNSLLNKAAFKSSTTTSFESETRDVECSYSHCAGYTLLVVDTPGLIDTKLFNVKYLEAATQNMTTALGMCNGEVDAFLVVLKFGCTFTLQRAVLDSLKEIFGEVYVKHAIIIISHGDLFQEAMEDKGLNISFQEWCQKQSGEIKRLYREFEGRCVLFNNRERDKDKKELQRMQIVRIAVSVRNKSSRYTYFEKVQEYRERLISQQQDTVFSEPVKESVRPLDADVEIYMGASSNAGTKSTTRLSKGLIQEFEAVSTEYDSLLPHRELTEVNLTNPTIIEQRIFRLESPEIAKDFLEKIQMHISTDDISKTRKMNFLLMGKTGNGKSATGNSILGYRAFKASASSTSETKEVKAGYSYFGRCRLKVVDGPGLGDTDMDKIRDIETAAENMAKAVMMCSEGVDAFLHVIAFGNRFTEEERSALESLKRIFGEKYFNHVIVIITRGDAFENHMEDEEHKITFEEWCRKQKGEFNELYKSCIGRFILFNNQEKNIDKKSAQVIQLLKLTDELSKNGRYNCESFKNAKSEREKMILEMKAPQLIEEIHEKIGLLRSEIDTCSQQPTTERKLILQKRIKDLEDEIIQQDQNYGVLSDLLTKVNKLREILDNLPNLQKASREIEDNVSFFWRIIKTYLAWWRRLLNGAFPVDDHRNESRR